MLGVGGLSHSPTFDLLSQLIRSGFDSIINLIFRLLFPKKRPAITLEDPNIKYALRLIDKEVTTQTLHTLECVQNETCLHTQQMRPRSLLFLVFVFFFKDCQP